MDNRQMSIKPGLSGLKHVVRHLLHQAEVSFKKWTRPTRAGYKSYLTVICLSGSPFVDRVQAIYYNGRCDDPVLTWVSWLRRQRNGYALVNALMRPLLVEVNYIFLQHTVKMSLTQDEQLVETFVPDTFEKPFAHGIGIRSSHGCLQDFDPGAGRDAGKLVSIFAIVIADEILWSLVKGRRLAQLLRYPSVARRVSDPEMNHTPRSKLDNEEHEIRLEEQIEHRQEIARPDILGMIVQKGRPRLLRLAPVWSKNYIQGATEAESLELVGQKNSSSRE